jgi:hypothetical protein
MRKSRGQITENAGKGLVRDVDLDKKGEILQAAWSVIFRYCTVTADTSGHFVNWTCPLRLQGCLPLPPSL